MPFISAKASIALRRAEAAALFFIGLGVCIATPEARAADTIQVTLDQARVLKLPDHTVTIILGNPIIADVTLLKRSNSMILTGKSFGETNLIALDKSGAALGESMVEVTAPDSDMIVQRGMERQSYACDPACQPTINLGDATKYETEVSSAIKARDTLAAPTKSQQQ